MMWSSWIPASRTSRPSRARSAASARPSWSRAMRASCKTRHAWCCPVWARSVPGVAGLGVIPGICRRLPEDVRVPHLGWNAVTAAGEGLVATGVAAFANSYALREAPAGWVPAWTTHGVRFVAALEQSGERLLACQFHPELSGAYGAALLERWLA